MRNAATSAPNLTTGRLEPLIVSWRAATPMRNGSAGATIETYTIAVGQLAAFLAEQGMPTEPEHIRREHVEAFISDLLQRRKPATATAAVSRSSAGSLRKLRSGKARCGTRSRRGCPRRRLRASVTPSSAPSWPPASGTRTCTSSRPSSS